MIYGGIHVDLVKREYLERCDDRKSYKYLVRHWYSSQVYDTAYPSVQRQGMISDNLPFSFFTC